MRPDRNGNRSGNEFVGKLDRFGEWGGAPAGLAQRPKATTLAGVEAPAAELATNTVAFTMTGGTNFA
jgi:hypothetical protein